MNAMIVQLPVGATRDDCLMIVLGQNEEMTVFGWVSTFIRYPCHLLDHMDFTLPCRLNIFED